MQLKTTIITPNSEKDPNDVIVEEITLPPVETWPEEVKADTAPASPAMSRTREIAKLDFDVSGVVQPFIVIQLVHPFRHPDLGIVKEIRVHRLTVGEIGDLLDNRPTGMPDLFDIYALQTNIPAPVLRGLIDVDGEAVTKVCYDFLPRYFRRVPIDPPAPSSTSPNGEQ
ncbi:hypothetical protein DEM27_31905 [Metarhizobium album]|uniref:Tail assembly chaperone E/41/14-like protein n=1 Tax=Metarhizobium album TaxID=2182425 RepID=A0A2U2DG56_9HYPH|nr:hypothetical protein [Rhizobium album]PWE52254.1 hypothetical protein DEM27_31905 [Rhizobium album]